MALKIEYGDKPFDEGEEGVQSEPEPELENLEEEARSVQAEVLSPEEEINYPPNEPSRSSEEEDNTYVFDTRVGKLELINYLPRVPREVLDGERDFTEEEWALASEDYNRGFRPIEKRYLIKYQVPDDASRFRTQEDLSRYCIKMSPGMIGRWVKATTNESAQRFPRHLLKDDYGFTQYAVAVYRNLMNYTCTRRFKADANGFIDWEKIDRDAEVSPIKDPELSEANPSHALNSSYWEKLQEQWDDYCNLMAWIEEYKQFLSLRSQQPEVMDFDGQGDRVLAQQMSQFAAKVELTKQAALQYLDQELDDLNKKAVTKAKVKAAKGRADALDAYAETFNQRDPQPVPEEEDLWSGEQS